MTPVPRSYVCHAGDCPALCQAFSSDPAGRAGAWVITCDHKGPDERMPRAACHVCTCDGHAFLAPAQARAEALQAELTEANRQADEEIRHLKDALRAEREAREKMMAVLLDLLAAADESWAHPSLGYDPLATPAYDGLTAARERARAALAAPGETKEGENE